MTEQVSYEKVIELDGIEVRRYPPLLLARVRDPYDDAAFSILFNYISGDNEGRRRIEMTTPVISTGLGTRIEMTAPVISDASSFSFVLPSTFTIETAPLPRDNRIDLLTLPSRHVATIRFSGRAYEREVVAKGRELLSVLKKHGVRTKGEPFLMRYNSPFAPGFMRRNEVGVEVNTDDLVRGGADWAPDRS